MIRELLTVALSLAIYVQTAGAFVWLAVVILLERARRWQSQRLDALEADFALLCNGTTGASSFVDRQRLAAVEQTLLVHGKRITWVIDHLTALADEDAARARDTDRIPITSGTPARAWFCSGCDKCFGLYERGVAVFGYCDDCGAQWELRDYP